MSEFPPISEMAGTFAKEISSWASSGFAVVPLSIAEERLSICLLCEFYKNARCTKCGCQMKAKTALATSECPIGKWGKFSGTPDANQTEKNPLAS